MTLDNDTFVQIAVAVILALLGYKQASPWLRTKFTKQPGVADPVEQEGPDPFELLNQRLAKMEAQLELLLERRDKHGSDTGTGKEGG